MADTKTIPINGKIVTLVEQTQKRGKGAGKIYYAPQDTELNYQFLVNLYGEDKIREAILIPFVKRFALGASNEARTEAIDEKTGSVDMQVYDKSLADIWSSLAERAESMRALKDRLEDLLGELGDITMSGKPPTDPEFLRVAGAVANTMAEIKKKKAKDEDQAAGA